MMGATDPDQQSMRRMAESWPTSIRERADGFEYGNIVSQGSLAILDNFLSECQKKGIYVIGIEPPFSPQVYEKMLTMSDDYGYMNQIPADVSAIFSKYGFEFYDYTDPGSLGITNKDMEDGVHTTERGSLMFFASVAEKSSVLRQYTNPQFLEDALEATSAERGYYTGLKLEIDEGSRHIITKNNNPDYEGVISRPSQHRRMHG